MGNFPRRRRKPLKKTRLSKRRPFRAGAAGHFELWIGLPGKLLPAFRGRRGRGFSEKLSVKVFVVGNKKKKVWALGTAEPRKGGEPRKNGGRGSCFGLQIEAVARCSPRGNIAEGLGIREGGDFAPRPCFVHGALRSVPHLAPPKRPAGGHCFSFEC